MKSGNKFIAALIVAAVVIGTIGAGCKKTVPPRQTTYTLKQKDVIGISGTITFTETTNTVTTIDVVINGGSVGSHPADIHSSSIIGGGPIAITLNPVDSTGKSSTSVTTLDIGTAINYSQLILFNGCVQVHSSATDLTHILAQADIGGNALTGTSKTYTLSAVTPNVSGTALFEQRVNDSTLITLNITGLVSNTSYPAFIHVGSVTTQGGGPVKATLQSVNGTTGKSYTNIGKLDNGITAVTYDNWLVYDGYIDVEASPTDTTVLCDGNIGAH